MNPERMPSSAEVAVVGGGVIGMSVALALVDKGLDVVLLERDLPGRAASWAGGGILSPLPPTQCPEAIRPLLERSLELYPAWCERLATISGIDPEYWPCGAVYTPQGAAPIELPRIAQVRNSRLMKALAATLRRRGVRIIAPARVSGWVVRDGLLKGVETDCGELQCARAVLAAGPWSASLCDQAGRPIKGQMLLYRMVPGDLTRVLIDDEAYVIPRKDGHVLVGSTLEDVGFDLETTRAAHDQLRLRGQLLWSPLARMEPVAQWAGLRPLLGVGTPRIEESADIEGLFIATGHYRIGITLAPGTAERLAMLMADSGRSVPAGPHSI